MKNKDPRTASGLIKVVLCLTVFALAYTSAANATPQSGAQLTREDLEAWLNGYLTRALQESHLAGAVISVVKDGKVLLQRGYGYADMEKKIPVDPQETLFRAGSISKLFTGTAVMQLVEQGKLSLDHDVNDYLDFKLANKFAKPITLRHLMTHTAGFKDVLKQLIVFDAGQLETLEGYVKDHVPETAFEAGSTPAYSNYGLALAGYIVQRISGEAFEEYIERHIFRPLGMERSSFRQPLPASLRATMAKGYLNPANPPYPFGLFGPSPAGALSTTGADMARFMLAHLQNGQFENQEILRPQTARLMHSRAFAASPALNGMGLVFWQHDRNGHRIIGHDGGNPDFRSNLRLFVDDGVGLFVSFNAIGPDGGVYSERSLVLDEFADRYFPAKDGEAPTLPTALADAQMLVGTYEPSDRKSSFFAVLSLLDQTEVTSDAAGSIALSSQTQLDGTAKHWHEVAPGLWREIGGQDLLSATIAGGRVTRIARNSDPAGVLLPAPAWRPSWLVPAVFAAAIVLAIGIVAWPIVALARRHYRREVAWTSSQRWLHRVVRIVALLDLTFLIGWAVLFQYLASGGAGLFATSFDPVLRLLQLTGLLGAIGTIIVLANALLALQVKNQWLYKGASVALALACLIFLGFGVASGILSQSLHY